MRKLIAVLLISVLHVGCTNNHDSPEPSIVESEPDFFILDSAVFDSNLKILLKLEGDEFRVVKIDVAHKYDVVKEGKKGALKPVFDDNAVTTITDIVLSEFNANVQQFQSQSPTDRSPCFEVYKLCFEIMTEIPKLLENGCHCDCVWFDASNWGAYIRCGEDVG
jgi:hypothetical protein